jgi:hypothetical protein
MSAGRLAAGVTSGSITYSPFNGNRIRVANAAGAIKERIIPAAGITMYGGGDLAASTVYYIYLWYDESVGQLKLYGQAQATAGHMTDPATGIEIDAAYPTLLYPLVGMVRTWTDKYMYADESYCGVLSYFNRRDRRVGRIWSANRSTTSVTFVELHSEIRGEFLTWVDEAVTLEMINQVSFAVTGGQVAYDAIAIDGNAGANQFGSSVWHSAATGANYAWPHQAGLNNQLSEGYHWMTVLGQVSGSTGSWNNNGNLGLSARVRG